MAEQQTQATQNTARRGRPAGSSKTTASSGNATRRHQKPSLSGRMGILERKVNQQTALLQKIARGVS